MGCMYSGKSTEVIPMDKTSLTKQLLGRNVMVINNSLDTVNIQMEKVVL